MSAYWGYKYCRHTDINASEGNMQRVNRTPSGKDTHIEQKAFTHFLE